MTATTEQKNMKKFIFETNFDDPSVLPVDDKKNAALEQIKSQAFAEGQQSALQSIEMQTADICAHISKYLQQIAAQYEEIQSAVTQKSLAVVLYSLQKLMPDILNEHAEEQIESAVRETLKIALDIPKLSIRVPETAFASVEPKLKSILEQSGFAGKAAIAADPGLKMGDCRIDWGNGGVEYIPSQTWIAVQETLRQSIPKKIASTIPDANADQSE